MYFVSVLCGVHSVVNICFPESYIICGVLCVVYCVFCIVSCVLCLAYGVYGMLCAVYCLVCVCVCISRTAAHWVLFVLSLLCGVSRTAYHV